MRYSPQSPQCRLHATRDTKRVRLQSVRRRNSCGARARAGDRHTAIVAVARITVIFISIFGRNAWEAAACTNPPVIDATAGAAAAAVAAATGAVGPAAIPPVATDA